MEFVCESYLLKFNIFLNDIDIFTCQLTYRNKQGTNIKVLYPLKLIFTMTPTVVLVLLLLGIISTHSQAFSTSALLSSKAHHDVGLKSHHSHDVEACDTSLPRSRREMLHSMMAVASTMAIFPPLAAEAASSSGAEKFVGTYSDPINHPGGKRTIKLVEGAIVGDYQLAEG